MKRYWQRLGDSMEIKNFFFAIAFLSLIIPCNFIHLENYLDPEAVNQNQLYINRKERFIRFDADDNELQIEIGISIPFIKVPLMTGNGVSDEKRKSEVTINVPGVVVSVMLILTSFVIIPFLFASGPDYSYTIQRSAKNDVWSLVEEVDDALSHRGIDSSSCMQKYVCWITQTSQGGKEGSIGSWVNYFTNTWWFKRLMKGTFVEEAMDIDPRENSCEKKFKKCSLTSQHVESFVKMVGNASPTPPKTTFRE